MQLQTSGQQVSFCFYPTYPLHYILYLLTGHPHPSREAERQNHSRDRGRGKLGASRGDVFQLPQLRGRADVPDPVARHPPERGTNPAMRCHTWSDNKPQQFSHKYGSTCVSFVFIRPKRQDLRSFCSSRPGNKAPAQRGVSLLNF